MALSMAILSVFLAITGAFGGGGVARGATPKDEGALKKWLDRLAKDLQERSLKHYLLL